MNKQYRALTAAELYAFERLARRERAKAQAQLLADAGRWLKQVFTAVALRPYAPRPAKVVRHA